MWWWVATILTWFISFAWIVGVMTNVIRHKDKLFSINTSGAVVFHGVTAILALFFLLKALGV